MATAVSRAGGKPAGLYRTLWRYAAGDRRRLVAFMAMLILAQLVKLAIPYLSGAAVDAMQGGQDGALATAGWDMALIFIACVASWALHGPARVLERYTAIRIRERFADRLYAKVTSLPLDWHEHHHSGDTIERVQKAGNALFGFAQHQFVYLQNAVSLIGPIAAVFILSVPTALAALLCYGLIAIVLIRFDRVMIRLNREQNRAQARYAATLVDCLGNIATVLTLRLAGPTQRLVGERLTAVFAPLRSSIVVNEAKWCVIDLLNNGIRCGLVVLYVWLAWRQGNPILLGSAVMVYQYAQQVGGVVSNMAGNYQDLIGYQTDLRCVDAVTSAAGRPAAEAAVPQDWREIRVARLNFRYAGKRRERQALRDVSLTLRRGERVALVGESGSGKSTLLRVLAGLYRAERASFAVDGEIRPDLVDLGAIATLAPQDPEVFAGSIAHNLTLGIDYDAVAIERACALAAFTPVIDALPAGLATEIAERGLNLSGGQKQRLAVARAILAARNSSLLLLDEPTSSLDPATEARVYGNLLAALPDACIVSAIHRLHLLERFDRVVLMEDGQVLDIGTAGELLERAPGFQELWLRYGAPPLTEPRVEIAPPAGPWRVLATRSAAPPF
jgi:ATP-binding cassette, subfamily B, bacterial